MKLQHIFLGILFTCIIHLSFAQKAERKGERIESFKIAFITKRLDLTSEEATRFWPVYNQYQSELKELRDKNKKVLMNAYINIETMSDKEIELVLDDEYAFKQNELNVIKKYLPQFKLVLPVRKVAKLFKAEEDFKTELLKRMQQNK